MHKKKVLVHSNFCKAFTGFGKHKKNLLKYLYATGKYEIVELVNAKFPKDEVLDSLPWKAIGMLPDNPYLIQKIKGDPTRWRNAGYGHEIIDQIISEEKPDIYLGIEDIWAFSGFEKKPWWNKINCIIHTTLDSLPILPEAVSMASKVKNYLVWASFAEKALHELGHKHVKTIRGSLETENFYKLSDARRIALRKSFGISTNFIIGFVFRNQLRKSVPNLLDGFALFKKKNPNVSAKLLLHTHWSEGWDIPRLIKEKDLKIEDILTTYFCKKCKQYHVSQFKGQNIECPNCHCKDSLETTNINNGVNESQLNEIYNLMDVYCHPFTSGGQEIPIQEAKLAELVTLVTNYSCGEDSCSPESGGIPLEWAEYREPGTQFIKASTSPESICNQLSKFYKLPEWKKDKLAKRGREWVLNNFGIEVVGQQFIELFDSFDPVDWSSIDLSFKQRNESYIPSDKLNNSDWLIDLYKNCLMMNIDQDDQGYKYWMNEFKSGKTRSQIVAFFHKTAKEENLQANEASVEKQIDFSRENKRIAYIMAEHAEDVFMSTSIVNSLKKTYPDHDIYFFTDEKYFELVDSCDSIYKLCNYVKDMDTDCFTLVGRANKKGLFDLSFSPYKQTKQSGEFLNHGRTKVGIEL